METRFRPKRSGYEKGQRLRAELTNAMPQDVTVHWHGMAIVNDMDGDVHLLLNSKMKPSPGIDFCVKHSQEMSSSRR
jgi:FtsP/CotA-like multicopper oxidase with cupredoxin domain